MLHGLLYTLDHIDGVCISLLLDDDLGTLGTVQIRLLIPFLYTINDTCDITKIDCLAAYMTDNDIKHLFCSIEFLFDTE